MAVIVLDAAAVAKLRQRGVSTLHAHGLQVAEGCRFEPPCSLKWMQIAHASEIGAFSYAVSGYYFAARIGRYVSIGEDVQIGRHGHPTAWASTSPVFYQPAAMVFDRDLADAGSVSHADFLDDQAQNPIRPTVIGNDVWIGHGAFVSPGVRIGDGAVVGAQSVVTKDVPPYAVVAGVPAVVKKMRFPDRIVERLQAARWWDFAFWQLVGARIAEPESFADRAEALRAEGASAYRPDFVRPEDLVLAARAA